MRAIYVLPVVAAVFIAGFVANVAAGELTVGDSIVQCARGQVDRRAGAG